MSPVWLLQNGLIPQRAVHSAKTSSRLDFGTIIRGLVSSLHDDPFVGNRIYDATGACDRPIFFQLVVSPRDPVLFKADNVLWYYKSVNAVFSEANYLLHQVG